ncbi:MAG: ATP-binding protein [Phenylobacterium sp.]|nr:ATP-binding protein [Phenylobacterium sp.]
MTPFAWPIRLVPRQPPHFIVALLVCAIALAISVLARMAVLGPGAATAVSATTFPALMVATIYAGPRWGWATLAGALLLGRGNPLMSEAAPDDVALTVVFLISGALTVLVCASLRNALLRLDAANAAHAAAERTAEATEARFRSLADSAAVLMWVTRTDGRREFANKTYVDFLGVEYEDAINFDWRKVLHPDDMAWVLKEQIARESAHEPVILEARYRRRDGVFRWVRSLSKPRWHADGAFQGYVGVGYDVTDARQAEDDLKRINELLAERVEAALAERDEAAAALQRAQKLEAVGQLTGGVAHDFNNLLTVVIGALDMMQRHPDDTARRERMIEAALGAARRGERLTQQLLAFARRQALKPSPMRIDGVLAESEALLRRAVGEAVQLTIAPAAPEAVANLDPSQFEAAIMNLVVNARDATPPGGRIRIETLPVSLADQQVEELAAGDYICVAVHDTGTGMDAATIARAFEPFFTTKTQGRGTGLGLSQVYGFTRQSGGAVVVDSAPGKGSSVCMYLPRVGDGTASEGAAGAAQAATGPALDVLLAEDDLQVGEMVEALLVDLGHRVRRAPHADAALIIVQSDAPIDLLLTDLIMPGDKTGVDLAREATALRPGLPVILSSGYTGEALSAARDAPWPLLQKPYGADQLGRAIAEVMDGRATSGDGEH